MEQRILGGKLKVSAVGLGCMGFTHAYGAPMPEDEAVKAIRDSLDFGYTSQSSSIQEPTGSLRGYMRTRNHGNTDG